MGDVDPFELEEPKPPKHGEMVQCDEGEDGVMCAWCAGFRAGWALGREEEQKRCEGFVEDALTSIQMGEEQV